MSAWCRACGLRQTTQAGACPSCTADLSIDAPPDSPIGLVYEVRGKLGVGRKQGIALAVDGDTVLLHFSPKDKDLTPVPITTAQTDAVPGAYSPATRLLYAADHYEGASWNRDQLRQRAAELCADITVVRRLVDEALMLGWSHTVQQAPLTSSEKAWRAAHHAATVGDEKTLIESLLALPASGYPHRGELLRPYVAAIRHDARLWQPVLDSLAGAKDADAHAIARAGTGGWREAIEGGLELLPEAARAEWSGVLDQLTSGRNIAAPSSHRTPAWQAAGLFSGNQRVDDDLAALTGLEAALVDDLVDAGRLTATAAGLDTVTGSLRTYLLARLNPARLSDEEVRAVGHLGETARRLYMSRDRASLSGLEPSRRVRHYQALLDVIDGGRPDPDRLDPETVALLALPTEVLEQLKDGATSTLPPKIAADPSLWPLFAEQAIAGRLAPDAGRAAGDPLNVWIGLHRLVGHIWEGKYADAIELGKLLVQQTASTERQQDEALSLTAFALFELGSVDEALTLLEDAVQGLYTENLLVNVSIVASHSRPEVGVRYLARLVEEAPTPELQRAGLSQAISVWEGSGLDFPRVLVPALRTVLGTRQSIADYLRFGDIAVTAVPEIVSALPNPGGELDAPYRIVQAQARLKNDKDFFMADLAKEFIRVYQSVGRPEWFNQQWQFWVELARDAVFVDWGEAPGSADFIDTVLTSAPDLLTQEERFVMAPQAGTHMSVIFAREGKWFNDRAWKKFFFDPIDEFLRLRNGLPDQQVEFLASNFTLTIGVAGVHTLGTVRDELADAYNPLVQRLRWDTQNRVAIISQMRRILDEASRGPLPLLESVVERMRRLNSTEDKRRALTRDLAGDVADWRSEIDNLRRNV